jgi:hypothetical protein
MHPRDGRERSPANSRRLRGEGGRPPGFRTPRKEAVEGFAWAELEVLSRGATTTTAVVA